MIAMQYIGIAVLLIVLLVVGQPKMFGEQVRKFVVAYKGEE